MSYLVIYPRRLSVQKLDGDHCPGVLLCDVLQYGLLVESTQTHIDLRRAEQASTTSYRIRVVQMEAIPTYYVGKFQSFLNDFVFAVKGMQPEFQSSDGVPTWNVHFNEICFLLAGDGFQIGTNKDLRPQRMRR